MLRQDPAAESSTLDRLVACLGARCSVEGALGLGGRDARPPGLRHCNRSLLVIQVVAMNAIWFAVILAVMQTAPLGAETAANNTASASEAIQHDAAKKEKGSEASIPVKNSDSPDKNQLPSNPPSNADKHISIVIQQPTSVSGWEKAYVILTALLVVVGAVGIGYAIQTLRAVQRQAVSMRRQTTHLRNSVIQARRAANAARKSADFAEVATTLAERADVLLLRVGVVPNSRTQRLDGDAYVEMEFKNFGRTRANNNRFTVSLQLPDVPNDDAVPDNVAVIIGAGDTQIVGFHRFREWLTQETFDKFLRGETVLRFSAKVTYDDVFGGSHFAQFGGYFDHRAKMFRVQENEAH